VSPEFFIVGKIFYDDGCGLLKMEKRERNNEQY